MDVKRKRKRKASKLISKFSIREGKKGEFDFKYDDFQVVMSQISNCELKCNWKTIGIRIIKSMY